MLKATLVSVMLFTLLLSVCTLAMGQAEQFLVGYWPFDEGSGKEAKDVSGNGNDGELIDGPKWVAGKYEKALEFAGGSYVNVPDDPSLDLIDAATVMCWFKLTDDLTATTRIMSKNNSIFVIFDFGNPGTLDFLVKPNNDFVESTTIFDVGEWYHFAGTFDKGEMKIYINGELEGEKKNAVGIDPSDLELWIGADDWQPPGSSFSGVIDDVRF
ncbi:MAG: LamG domain-containing protein, partial [bacterium]